MKTKIIEFKNYQVEVDVERGVIYVHRKEFGTTAIRICGLVNSRKVEHSNLRRIGDQLHMIDITILDNGKTTTNKI